MTTTTRWTRHASLAALLAAALGSILVTAQDAALRAPATASLGEPASAADAAAHARLAAVAALAGDAVPDLLVGPGSGSMPTRVLSGVDGAELLSGFPFGGDFTGGIRVATGDVTGDGIADLVAAMGQGGSLVRVCDGASAAPVIDGHPFGTAFTGGVFVATGDMNGDGRGDVVVGAGDGSGLVRGYDVEANLLFSFAPFGEAYTGGVQVAVGDVDGDGRGDLVTAQAQGGLVTVFSAVTQSTIVSGYPFGPGFAGGLSVAAGDVDGDRRADVIVGPWTGGGSVQVCSMPSRRRC